MGQKLRIGILDIEANNLYQHVTKGHCTVIIDYHTKERHIYRPHQMQQSAEDARNNWDVLVGHNILDYDMPALTKLYGVDFVGMMAFDTIVASRTLNPDRPGGHSLNAWGQRLGCLKGEFGEQEDAWEVFTEDMLSYCIQDVEVTLLLFERMMEDLGFDIETFINYGEVI